MPLLRINALDDGLALHGSAQPLGPTLARMAQGTGPIVIMVHGFRFAPGAGADCPHAHILSTQEAPHHWKALSWPRALGFGTGQAPGLGIAFGWSAMGSLWRAFGSARRAGGQLADLVNRLHRLAPHRPIHAIGHSMGARVILSALPQATPGALHRLILLNPAEFAHTAQAALTTPAGHRSQTFCITSRENALFDLALACLLPHPGQRTLSSAPPALPNLTTLRLDDPDTLDALATQGLPVAPPQRRICHWSAYLRPGVFDLYRALLMQPHPPALPQTCRSRLSVPLRPRLAFGA